MDRTYIEGYNKVVHAIKRTSLSFTMRQTECGLWRSGATHDRIPPDSHLCGNCARAIAAHTDVEPKHG